MLEYVLKTHSAGDARKAESHPTHHDAGPVLVVPEDTKDLGAKAKEKKDEKKPEDSDSHKHTTKSKVIASTDETEVTDRDDIAPHTVEPPEEEAEVDEGETGEALLRRSKRDRKPPKRFESYHMHQITSRPVDRRLQTLQMLLGTGVFNELDSDMTNNILDAVMK